MSQASAQSTATTSGQNRDTISGGTINPIVAVALVVAALVAFIFWSKRKR